MSFVVVWNAPFNYMAHVTWLTCWYLVTFFVLDCICTCPQLCGAIESWFVQGLQWSSLGAIGGFQTRSNCREMTQFYCRSKQWQLTMLQFHAIPGSSHVQHADPSALDDRQTLTTNSQEGPEQRSRAQSLAVWRNVCKHKCKRFIYITVLFWPETIGLKPAESLTEWKLGPSIWRLTVSVCLQTQHSI